MRALLLAAVVGSMLGVRLIAPPGAAPSALLKVQPSDIQAGDLAGWILLADGDHFRARQLGTGTGVAPHFDTVLLGRGSGASEVTCGEFEPPTLTDNGFLRVWEYTVARPASGPCASATGDYVAVGRRGAAATRTATVR